MSVTAPTSLSPGGTLPGQDQSSIVSVLLIDDDPDEHLLLRRLLSRSSPRGYELSWVGSFEEGEAEIGRGAYDVYLLDYRLGSRDGLDLLRLARAGGCRRPVIVLTGFGDPAIERRVMEAGAADYLTKGRFDPEALDRSIRYSLQRARIQEALVDAESRFRGAFDHAPIGMALVDGEGVIGQANPALARLLGCRKTALVGRRLTDLVDSVVPESYRMVVTRPGLSRHLPESAEAVLIRSDGESIEVQMGLSQLREPETWDGFVVQVVDLTELRATNRKLEASLAEKDEFLASVSHELRTPLTAVLGFARLLSDDYNASQESAGLATTIYEQALDLANIVEDILVGARAQIGDLTVALVPVDLRAQAMQVLQVAPPLGDVAVVGEGVTAMADPARLRQILRNLLTNASRYGGRQIAVTIEATDSDARVEIADNGPGLSPTDWERVFEPYQRAHEASGVTKSLGLGLAISRRLARLMGGDLTYSYTGEWSRFELTLPLTRLLHE